MTAAAVPPLLIDLGAAAGALTAIVLFLVLIGKSRPMRWLWKTLIAEPLAAFFRAQVAHEVEPRIAEVSGRVAAVEAQLKPNGGSSAYDMLQRRLDSVERGQRKIFAQLGAEGSLEEEDDPEDG